MVRAGAGRVNAAGSWGGVPGHREVWSRVSVDGEPARILSLL